MALKVTKDMVRLACASDPTITVARVKAVLAELDGEGVREMMQDEPPPRAYNRAQVATLMGCSRKTVTGYAKHGLLVPIYSGAGRKRAQAYTGESVTALLSGRVSPRG